MPIVKINFAVHLRVSLYNIVHYLFFYIMGVSRMRSGNNINKILFSTNFIAILEIKEINIMNRFI